MFLCFRSIVRCLQCFVRGLSPFGKVVSPRPPPHPLELSASEPPSPSEFPMIFCGGRGEYGYFL